MKKTNTRGSTMNKALTIPIKFFSADAGRSFTPVKAYETDACYDVMAAETVFIAPGKVERVRLGFGLQLPVGWEAQIRPRSGLNSKGILALFGTIDAAYRGEVAAVIFNASGQHWSTEPGMRVAQMAIRPIYDTSFTEVVDLEASDRGDRGFGSSGLKGV